MIQAPEKQRQPDLYGFKDSLVYRVRPCLQNIQTTTKQKRDKQTKKLQKEKTTTANGDKTLTAFVQVDADRNLSGNSSVIVTSLPSAQARDWSLVMQVKILHKEPCHSFPRGSLRLALGPGMGV